MNFSFWGKRPTFRGELAVSFREGIFWNNIIGYNENVSYQWDEDD